MNSTFNMTARETEAELKRREIPPLWYDYTNQAWVRDGRYVACSHPASMECGCYGTAHAGELADPSLCLQW